MLTYFSKSSSRLTDRFTLMSSVSCPSNSEIGQYDHWVPRWRVSCMSAVADPLLTSLDNVSSPHVSALSVWSTPFLLPHFCNFVSRFLHDTIFSLIDSIPHSVTDSCKSWSSIVIRRSKYVLSRFVPSFQTSCAVNHKHLRLHERTHLHHLLKLYYEEADHFISIQGWSRCRPGATPQFILPTDSVNDVKQYRHSIHKILLHKSKRVDRVHATGTLTRSNVCVKSNKSVIVPWFSSLI